MAWEIELRVRKAKKAASSAPPPPSADLSSALGKHRYPDEDENDLSNLKRPKVEETAYGGGGAGLAPETRLGPDRDVLGNGSGAGPVVDVSDLPLDAVIDIVMRGLRGASAELVNRAFDVSFFRGISASASTSASLSLSVHRRDCRDGRSGSTCARLPWCQSVRSRSSVRGSAAQSPHPHPHPYPMGH